MYWIGGRANPKPSRVNRTGWEVGGSSVKLKLLDCRTGCWSIFFISALHRHPSYLCISLSSSDVWGPVAPQAALTLVPYIYPYFLTFETSPRWSLKLSPLYLFTTASKSRERICLLYGISLIWCVTLVPLLLFKINYLYSAVIIS